MKDTLEKQYLIIGKWNHCVFPVIHLHRVSRSNQIEHYTNPQEKICLASLPIWIVIAVGWEFRWGMEDEQHRLTHCGY